MNTYLIGDVHGCYDELMQLLDKINFQQGKDRLIFAGDLINRGPKSIDVLRFVKDLGASAEVVLGNHDISLLAYAADLYDGKNSDFPEIMSASDSDSLVEWLRHQPLLICDKALDFIVTHAGLPPRWSINTARKQAAKAEAKLRGKKWKKYLRYAYKKGGEQWEKDFSKYDKFRYRINGFTRMRYCNKEGEIDLSEKGPLGKQSKKYQSWFDCRLRLQNDKNTRLFFGHWAALGYKESVNAHCIDSGCVWGGYLTAIKVEKNAIKRHKVKGQKKNGECLKKSLTGVRVS